VSAEGEKQKADYECGWNAEGSDLELAPLHEQAVVGRPVYRHGYTSQQKSRGAEAELATIAAKSRHAR
jgi:hypothetical protein